MTAYTAADFAMQNAEALERERFFLAAQVKYHGTELPNAVEGLRLVKEALAAREATLGYRCGCGVTVACSTCRARFGDRHLQRDNEKQDG